MEKKITNRNNQTSTTEIANFSLQESSSIIHELYLFILKNDEISVIAMDGWLI